ncbi:hypothetical protein GCM10027347_31890 [Larkinella harenae]
MSTTKRLISGTAASWARIGVTMLTQIALVPIVLSYWNIGVYGMWIAIQALVNVLSTLDRGYSDYLQFEFLKLGVTNRKKVASLLWSGMSVVVIISLLELIILYFIAFHSNINSLFDTENISNELFRQEVAWSLMIQWVIWIFANIIGLFYRALCPFGYYPRMEWWNVAQGIISSVATVIVISNGAGLLGVNISSLIVYSSLMLIQYIGIHRAMNKERLNTYSISIKEGVKAYITSITLSARYFLENFKQQGVRLLLAPLVGAVSLAAFVTTRTGANVALQGLSTITNPLMPELMRFLHQKEQQKMQMAFDSIWLVVVAILSPCVLFLQAVAPYLFTLWTKGKITYDPYLFASLSLGVLVYGIAQPATAIATGNNLLKVQMMISLLSSLIVVSGIFFLVPYISIVGAGIALLIAEIAATFGFQYYAKKWLYSHGMDWPHTSFMIAVRSILITAVGMVVMTTFPLYQWLTLLVCLIVLVWNITQYWKTLSIVSIEKVASFIRYVPFLGKLYYDKTA